MIFDLDQRTVALAVGEFSAFALGPRESGDGGGAGIWRAQLGTHWHNELRQRAIAEHAAAAEFEIPIAGQIFHRGWRFTLNGRIDQLIRPTAGQETMLLGTAERGAEPRRQKGRGAHAPTVLREIKSITRELPADEAELRRDYPEYFIQLASYVALARSGLLSTGAADASEPLRPTSVRGELVFVETGHGLAQTIAFTPAEDALFKAQLDRIADFLDLRLRARQRLRGLRFRAAFAQPRPGQETTLTELTSTFERKPLVLFEAPTGFGKTGVLLEFALGQLKAGHFDRALYLTSKSTGQLQVVRTLAAMTAPEASSKLQVETLQATTDPQPANLQPSNLQPATTPVAVWHVRNKAEHCVNTTFHCVRDNCAYLAGAAERWAASGLARFYLDERHVRDLESLRRAGRDARICPYEITRAALAFNDVWIGDYNYVFAPRNRTLFYEQPGFTPARTLLLIDEAHNLPSRVADAYSHEFQAAEAYAVRDELHRVRPVASLVTAWDHWCHFLHHLKPTDGLSAADEDDARHLLDEIAKQVATVAIDYAVLSPQAADALWRIPALLEDLRSSELPRLWWVPRGGELLLTCLDAAKAIGATLREFGGVVLASATLTPVDGFTVACGLDETGDAKPEIGRSAGAARNLAAIRSPPSGIDAPDRLGNLNKRETKKLYRQLTSASELLRVEEARDAASPALLRAHAPWREGTYRIAFDARVDTTFQHRSRFYAATAATVAELQNAARGPIAIFFPSYAYADAIKQQLAELRPAFRAGLQPKVRDLAAQTAWVEESLLATDALFLVLGSSFAESIDVLGGRITHAMIVGPALPEVNAVQRARLQEASRRGLDRDAAFRQVYQIPGMTKVNQALGRLVRGPGQQANVLLHCRRFREPAYLALLAPEYQVGTTIENDAEFENWLRQSLS